MTRLVVSTLALFCLVSFTAAQEAITVAETAAALRKLQAPVLAPDAPERQAERAALKALRDEVNRKDREAWAKITSKEAWEAYRDARLALLRQSLGTFPKPPDRIEVVTTKKIDGDGFVVENLVFESRPGLVVTANLYAPKAPGTAMPGILIVHSHHNPKTQGELQDMGMTWARQGCVVLVPDQLGHGERRQHPFATDKDFPRPFKVGRQDYYFRYNAGVQLQLVGESLMGWMVWDLMRGIDVLCQRPGVAKDKVVVLGSVAGGGDPAAVLAALDRRVAAVAPFNFGGPQPETKFPLPADADAAFNFMGGGSWESTRNLRLSGRDGFLPWVIVAAAAPRGLIYAHEFAWDETRDPVWRRLQTIYDFYDAREKLASLHGRGSVKGTPPESTHCNNIGPEHRKGIYPPLAKWFGLAPPDREYQKRLPADQLQCLTAEARAKLKPVAVCDLARRLARPGMTASQTERNNVPPIQRRGALQRQWADLLGLEVLRDGRVDAVQQGKWPGGRWNTQVIRHPRDAAIAVPVLWLLPAGGMENGPAVVAVAHAGKAGFLEHRAETIARLLQAGVAVCLPDLRGTGELRNAGNARGRTSSDTALSASAWMHGRTVLGGQVRDLLLVLDTVRHQGFGPIALWGDSFAPVNGPETQLAVPHDAERAPRIGEPMGGLAVLLAGLLAPDGAVRAIHADGGLASYRSVLADPFFYVPHDALVPGALTVGDLGDVAQAWAPRPLSFVAPIDGHNRRVKAAELRQAFARTRVAYEGLRGTLMMRDEPASAEAVAAWLTRALGKP